MAPPLSGKWVTWKVVSWVFSLMFLCGAGLKVHGHGHPVSVMDAVKNPLEDAGIAQLLVQTFLEVMNQAGSGQYHNFPTSL